MKFSKVFNALTTATVVTLLSSQVAMAAIPTPSIVLGQKAFSTDCLFDANYVSAINAALANANGNMDYNLGTGWQDIMTNANVNASTLPEVTYDDGKGNLTKYAAGDGPAENQATVASVSALTKTAVTVANGTALADAAKQLDQSVTLSLSDNSTTSAAITWTSANYSATTAGDYTFTGAIALPSGVTDPSGKAANVSATVTVSPVGFGVTSVATTDGTNLDGATNIGDNASMVVTFNDAVDSSTINSNSVTLASAAGTPVAYNSSYNGITKQLTIVPTIALTDSTSYTLTVTTAVKNSSGAAAVQKAVTFQTGSTPVVSGLSVGGTSITANSSVFAAANLGVGNDIVVSFNKDVDQSTVSYSNFKLFNITTNAYVQTANLAYSAAAKTATFDVATQQAGNSQFRVEVNGVKALDGTSFASYSAVFSVANNDTAALQTPAALTNVYPRIAASTVNGAYYGGFKLVYLFATPINPATVTSASVQIRPQGSTTGVPATVAVDSSGTLLTITPTADLADQTTYSVWFDTNVIKGAAGQGFTDPATTFTTGDFTAPTVTSSTPTNGATGITETDPIRINFSEAINPATVAATNAANTDFAAGTSIIMVDSANAGKNISGALSWENGNKTLVISTAALGLTRNTTYTVKIHGGSDANLAVRDMANVNGNGNLLASDQTFTFTTRAVDTAVPSLSSIAQGTTPIINGLNNVSVNQDLTVTFDRAVALGAGTLFTFTDVNAPTGAIDTTATTNGNTTVAVADGTQYRVGDRISLSSATLSPAVTRTITAIVGNNLTVDAVVAPSAANVSITRTAATFTNLTAGVALSNGNMSVTIPLSGANMALANDRLYRLTIAPSLIRNANNAAVTYAGSSLNFTTGARPVVDTFNGATSPQPMATGVAITAHPVIVVTDDVGVLDSTINTNDVTLTKASDGTSVPVTLTLGGTAAARQITITPTGNLSNSTQYTVTVNGVTDAAGNPVTSTSYTFTTVDNSTPTLTSVTPANNTSGIATTSQVSVVFGSDMNIGTLIVGANNIMLETAAGVPAIVGNSELGYNSATRTLTITPATPLAPNTTYEVVIGTNVQGTNGQAFSTAQQSYFRTAAAATGGTFNNAILTDAAGSSTQWDAAGDAMNIYLSQPLSRDFRTGTLTQVNYTDGAFGTPITGGITAAATTLTVSDASQLSVGMGIEIAGAGPAAAALDTYITAIAGTDVTVANAAGTTVAAAAVTMKSGYSASATTLNVDNGTVFAAGDKVTVAGQNLTVASSTATTVTFTTAVGAAVADNANLTATSAVNAADFTVTNGSLGGGTYALSADRKTITITWGAGGVATKGVTTIAPAYNSLLDTNSAPFNTTAVTLN